MDLQKPPCRSLFDLGEVHVMCPWLSSHPSGDTGLERTEGYVDRWQEGLLSHVFPFLHIVFCRIKDFANWGAKQAG